MFNNDSAANTGAQRDHNRIVRPARGARNSLAPGGGVCVVLDGYPLNRKALAQKLRYREMTEGQIVCVLNNAGVVVGHAGRRNTDRPHIGRQHSSRIAYTAAQQCNVIDDLFGRTGRLSRQTVLYQYFKILSYKTGRNVGPSEVNSYSVHYHSPSD